MCFFSHFSVNMCARLFTYIHLCVWSIEEFCLSYLSFSCCVDQPLMGCPYCEDFFLVVRTFWLFHTNLEQTLCISRWRPNYWGKLWIEARLGLGLWVVICKKMEIDQMQALTKIVIPMCVHVRVSFREKLCALSSQHGRTARKRWIDEWFENFFFLPHTVEWCIAVPVDDSVCVMSRSVLRCWGQGSVCQQYL